MLPRQSRGVRAIAVHLSSMSKKNGCTIVLHRGIVILTSCIILASLFCTSFCTLFAYFCICRLETCFKILRGLNRVINVHLRVLHIVRLELLPMKSFNDDGANRSVKIDGQAGMAGEIFCVNNHRTGDMAKKRQAWLCCSPHAACAYTPLSRIPHHHYRAAVTRACPTRRTFTRRRSTATFAHDASLILLKQRMDVPLAYATLRRFPLALCVVLFFCRISRSLCMNWRSLPEPRVALALPPPTYLHANVIAHRLCLWTFVTVTSYSWWPRATSM